MFELATQPRGGWLKKALSNPLSPQMARYLVVGPTLALSLVLGGYGYPILPRVTLCIAVGSMLILLVARYQRSRMS